MLLTTEEIKEALIAQGGENVVIVLMREPIESMTHLVITSGRSTRHLRKMSDSIVQAVSRTSMYTSYLLGTLETTPHLIWGGSSICRVRVNCQK